MAYIKRFQEIFKKEKDKEDTVAYFGSKTKIEKFSEKEITMSKGQEVPGVVLYSGENSARNAAGPYVTKVKLTLNSIIHDAGNYKIKRDDALFMVNKSPMKAEEIKRLNLNKQRDAGFDAIDFVLSSKSAIEGYERIYENFYEGYKQDFVRNVSKLGYDALVIEKDNRKKYIVFNTHAIELLK